MAEPAKQRERRERLFREATEYHLHHALRLIDRTPVDLWNGRVGYRRYGPKTIYDFLGDPILEVTYEEKDTPANPLDNYPIATHDQVLHFKHLKGNPPAPMPTDRLCKLFPRISPIAEIGSNTAQAMRPTPPHGDDHK